MFHGSGFDCLSSSIPWDDVQPTLQATCPCLGQGGDEVLGSVASPPLAEVSCLVPGRGTGREQPKGTEEEKAFFLSGGRLSPSSHFLQQTPRMNPRKCRQSLTGLPQTFMHLIHANTEQNELNIANCINNLNSVAKNSQEYLNNLKVFTCKFYKFSEGRL